MLHPGAVIPAQPAYGALIEALGPDVQTVAKDLELYAGNEPPPGWSLDTVRRDAAFIPGHIAGR